MIRLATRAAILSLIALVPITAASQTCGGRANCCEWTADSGEKCPDVRFYGPRIAIVVGTDAYKVGFGEHLSDLENARNDALAVGDNLDKQGFSVRYLLNPTLQRAIAELSAAETYMRNLEFDETLDDDDMVAVIYVAGHGFSFEDQSGRISDYLVFRPSSMGWSTLSLNEIFTSSRYRTDGLESRFDQLNRFKILFLIDACRSLDPLVVEMVDEEFRGSPPRQFRRQDLAFNLTETAEQFSTTTGQPAADTSNFEGAGLYAAYLARALAVPGLTPLQVMSVSRILVAADGGVQIPSKIETTGSWVSIPWREPQGTCQRQEAALWSKLSRCGSLDERCERNLCSRYRDYQQALGPHQCDLTGLERALGAQFSKVCFPPASEIDTIAPRPASLFDSVEVSSSAIDPSEALTYAVAANVERPSIAFGFSPSITAFSDRNARDLSDAELRDELITPRDVLRSGAGISAQPTDQFELKSAPRESSATILRDLNRLGTDVEVRIDCENIACGNGWVGVTVYDGNTKYRGFSRQEGITAKNANRIFFVNLGPNSFSLSNPVIKKIEKMTKDAINKNAMVLISIEGDRSSAVSIDHAVSIENLILDVRLSGTSIPEDRVITNFYSVRSEDVFRATIQFFY